MCVCVCEYSEWLNLANVPCKPYTRFSNVTRWPTPTFNAICFTFYFASTRSRNVFLSPLQTIWIKDEGCVVLHVTLNVLIMEMTGRLVLPLPPQSSPSASTARRVTTATAEPNPNFTRDHPWYVITGDVSSLPIKYECKRRPRRMCLGCLVWRWTQAGQNVFVSRSSHSRASGTAGFLTVQLSQTPVTVQSLFMCAVMGDHEHTGPVPCGVMVLYRGLKSSPKPHF